MAVWIAVAWACSFSSSSSATACFASPRSAMASESSIPSSASASPASASLASALGASASPASPSPASASPGSAPPTSAGSPTASPVPLSAWLGPPGSPALTGLLGAPRTPCDLLRSKWKASRMATTSLTAILWCSVSRCNCWR
uniref:Putative secreted protein n=1 Tax=Ixodes ricinus TaxID=34613 RepID=A0A6B0UTR1_IXORI